MFCHTYTTLCLGWVVGGMMRSVQPTHPPICPTIPAQGDLRGHLKLSALGTAPCQGQRVRPIRCSLISWLLSLVYNGPPTGLGCVCGGAPSAHATNRALEGGPCGSLRRAAPMGGLLHYTQNKGHPPSKALLVPPGTRPRPNWVPLFLPLPLPMAGRTALPLAGALG